MDSFDLIFSGIYYGGMAAFWLVICSFGWGMVRGLRSRRHVSAAVFGVVMILVLWGGLFLGYTPGASAYASYRHSVEMFGRGFAPGPIRHSYHSERAFNGDGYSIEVVEVPDSFAAWATLPPPEFTAAYPLLPGYRSHWKAVHWHQSPISSGEWLSRTCRARPWVEDVEGWWSGDSGRCASCITGYLLASLRLAGFGTNVDVGLDLGILLASALDVFDLRCALRVWADGSHTPSGARPWG